MSYNIGDKIAVYTKKGGGKVGVMGGNPSVGQRVAENNGIGVVHGSYSVGDTVLVNIGKNHKIGMKGAKGGYIGYQIVSWGWNDYGQVSNTPTGYGFIAISAGAVHSLALRTDGSIVAWGKNDYGQVSNTPPGNDLATIARGWRHSLALKTDGSIVAWGYDYVRQVSNTPSGNDFVAISAGGSHSVALRFP